MLLQRGGWQGEVTRRVLMLRPFGNEKAHRLQQAGPDCRVPSDARIFPAAC